MYSVTFYSYKGGVGRSMAMVNVAVQLCQTGRKVLLVDFDLEAPGIPTFNFARSQGQVPGVVDYVTQFASTGEAPDVREFIYESQSVPSKAGRLWIMPAGRLDDDYGDRLNSIDWQKLYSEQSGYLMFEDLKRQWKQHLNPDYVLIDSRTGHTDVGGICTRQLPDAVVILFFPNEQNLFGLKKVVADIRAEKQPPRRKNIDLHFVVSNVPDLDDEDQIIANRLATFQQTLGYKSLASQIHHYDSLSLVDQLVFSLDRPRSRLAKEYGVLTTAITEQNPADRDAVLSFLRRLVRGSRAEREELSPVALENRLDSIFDLLGDDAEVCFYLGVVREQREELDAAMALFNKAIDGGFESVAAFLRRASVYQRLGQGDKAEPDILGALESSDANYEDVAYAVRLLRTVKPTLISAIPNSIAFRALPIGERVAITADIEFSRQELLITKSIASSLLQEPVLTESERRQCVDVLGRSLIGLGEFDDAIKALNSSNLPPAELDIQTAFNTGMASWGATHEIPITFFQRVVELDVLDTQKMNSPNYSQCLAIANWGIGNFNEATAYLKKARSTILSRPARTFSAWRFIRTTSSDFIKDLDEIARLIEGKKVLPHFMRH